MDAQAGAAPPLRGSARRARRPALLLVGLMACAARLGEAQSQPRVVAVVALLAAVPLAARADGLPVAALLTAVLAALVIAEQARRRRRLEPRRQSSVGGGPTISIP
jgi:hypothetical protein